MEKISVISRISFLETALEWVKDTPDLKERGDIIPCLLYFKIYEMAELNNTLETEANKKAFINLIRLLATRLPQHATVLSHHTTEPPFSPFFEVIRYISPKSNVPTILQDFFVKLQQERAPFVSITPPLSQLKLSISAFDDIDVTASDSGRWQLIEKGEMSPTSPRSPRALSDDEGGWLDLAALSSDDLDDDER